MEERVKSALKYWGYTEVYTYSLVGENLYEGSTQDAIKLKNPLTEDMKYLRNALAPSLIQVATENKSRDNIKIFELSNIYEKKGKDLPKETLTLAGLIKAGNASFFGIKGLIEQIFTDFGIGNYKFRRRSQSPGADIYIGDKKIGYAEILNQQVVDFELNFEEIKKHADFSKNYKALAKFPAIVEDITFVLPEGVSSEDVISEISLQSFLIVDVNLKDTFNDAKTFHIVYQAEDRNLTNKDVAEIRGEVIKAVSEKYSATVK
jgi:phenylalanyl-tRNA synthetase beta chain